MEIVIENPVESSSPPPPPPPPPPQPPPLISPTPWNGIVSVPTVSKASSLVTSSSMPAATTVMTITIAENPTVSTYPPPPVRFSYRETYASNSIPFTGDPYSSRRGQALARPYDEPDGASPSVRRTDKSGLLGISESDAPSLRTGLRSPRFLSTTNTCGMISPRRLECIGQLDPVPEVPGQISRANVSPGSPNVFTSPTTKFPVDAMTLSMLGQERRDGSPLESCEMLSVSGLERPLKSASFDSLESRYRKDHEADNATPVHGLERRLDGIESLQPSDYGLSYRFQENCETRERTVARLSQFGVTRNNALESVARYSETCCNFPFAVRTPTTYSGFEGSCSLPSTRATTTTATTSTATVAVSTMREIETSRKKEDEIGNETDDRLPDEERAEAEGCEHGSTTKDGESVERGDEMAENDGIQTLRVIILSEQL